MKIKLLKRICKRCGHSWVLRKAEEPMTCPNPKCRSPYWDRERRIKRC